MRILFYYTHKQTLGHTTRSISLVNALIQQGAKVLVLQGGLPQPFVHFPRGCKVLNIPCPFDTRTSFRSTSHPIALDQRSAFILKAAVQFNPDVLVTEFFPFGRLSYLPELLGTLRYLRQKEKKIVASIGYPLLDFEHMKSQQFLRLWDTVVGLYDALLIHTPPGLEEPYIQRTIPSPRLARSYADIMCALKNKIVHTGYIFPEKMSAPLAVPLVPKDTPALVISRGGGAVYPKLISTAIAALRLLQQKTPAMIACGPATTPEEMALFRSCLTLKDTGRITLTNDCIDLDHYLRTCPVSVSLSGYNTSVQLMRWGTPAVIVPYENESIQNTTNDQRARSVLLAERFSSTLLSYSALTSKALANAMHARMTAPRPAPAPADWFDGAARSARFIVRRKGTRDCTS